MIKLADETMWREDLQFINEFIQARPERLSQSETVLAFEKTFATYNDVNHAVFVNSGSSANLLMVYALIETGRLKNKTVVVPAVSWATTVSPWMQYGFNIILCDADKKNLGMDCDHLAELCDKHEPAAIMPVHVLGMPADIQAIKDIAEKHSAILLEDCCESLGSEIAGKHLGTFGTMASFSTFVPHQLSTVEGGIIITNDDKLDTMLRLLRAHGWNRDIKATPEYQSVDTFQDKYNFYVPGFNMRNQELNAYLGLRRIATMKQQAAYRNMLFDTYQEQIKNKYWKPKTHGLVSSMAYPVIHRDREKIVAELEANQIECRPLIAGSMEYQPMYERRYGFKEACPFATNIHKYGFYVPVHCNMDVEDVKTVTDIINSYYIEDVVNIKKEEI